MNGETASHNVGVSLRHSVARSNRGSGPYKGHYQADDTAILHGFRQLVKTGGGLVKHARYYWLLLAEGYPTRQRFGSMLRRIPALPLPNG